MQKILFKLMFLSPFLVHACKYMKSSNLQSSIAETRTESYFPVKSGMYQIQAGQVLQFRAVDNTEMCMVSRHTGFEFRQCDGKAHWVVIKKGAESDRAYIKSRVSGACIKAGNTLTSEIPKPGSIGCAASEYEIRFDNNQFQDSSGKKATISDKAQIWVPFEAKDLPSVENEINMWNADLSYSNPVQMNPDGKTDLKYFSDGWTHSNKKWLTSVQVGADPSETYIQCISTVYFRGMTPERHDYGKCGDDQVHLKSIFMMGPEQENLDAVQLLAFDFLTAFKVIQVDGLLVGVELENNISGTTRIIAPKADTKKAIETNIVPYMTETTGRDDQIIAGLYGEYSSQDGSIRNLGVIGASYVSYAYSWQADYTTEGLDIEKVYIRQAGTVVGPWGHQQPGAFGMENVSVPNNSQDGYFETVTATNAAERHWISSIQIYSGGGYNNTDPTLPFFITEYSNDMIGFQVTHSYMDRDGNKSRHDLSIGPKGTKIHESIYFAKYEFLSKMEYRSILEGHLDKLADRWLFEYRPNEGLSSLRFTITDAMTGKERVVTWDAASPLSASSSQWDVDKLSKPMFTEWKSFNMDSDRAIIGFYGINGSQKNPFTNKSHPAIKKFGPISTTIGCAFRFKQMTDDEIEAIEKVGLMTIKYGQPSCIPPQQ